MKVLLLAVTLVACSPTLDVPSSVTLNCTLDTDCFSGQCVDGACSAVTDTTPPRLIGAHAASDTAVTLSFSEPLGASATDVAGYTTVPPLTFTSATLSQDGASVTLQTAVGLGHSVSYVITATRATDVVGNSVDATADSATFASFFGAPSGLVPTALAPLANAAAPHLTATLTWLPVADAESYQVEVAEDASFATLAIPAITVLAPATQTTVTMPSAIPYTWRVRADVSPTDVYSSGSFDALGDTIYVYCASATTCSNALSGNMRHPLGSIQAAVVLAQSLGVTTVAIAGRGGGQSYTENVVVRDSMVDLLGGYAPDFSTANAAMYPTIVEGYDAVIELDNVGAMHVDGLTVRSAPAAARPTGIAVNDCTGAVTISNTAVNVTAVSQNAVGIDVVSASPGCSLTLTDATIQSNGPTPTGIATSSLNLVVSNATVSVDGGSSSGTGVSVSAPNGSGHIDIGTTAIAVNGSPNTIGVSLQTPVIGASSIHDSVISSASGDGINGNVAQIAHCVITAPGAAAYGVYIANPQTTVVSDSVVVGGVVGVANAANVVGSTLIAQVALQGASVVTNDILFGSSACLDFTVGSTFATLASLQNNAFADCAILVNATTQLTTIGAVNALAGSADGSGNHRSVSANVFTSKMPTDIFVSPPTGDYHLNLTSTPASIKTGGKDATSVTCGVSEAPVACGGSATDVYGTMRAPPLSIGAAQAN